MSKYPKWKLIELTEYTGGLNNNVFKYLDDLHSKPETVHESLGYNKNQIEHISNKNIARDCLGYIKTLSSDDLSSQQKDQLEKDFILSMREKYIRHNWIAGRKANKNL